MRALSSIIAILLVFTFSTSQSQILNKLKRAAKDGVQDAVERRVAHEVEKAVQKQTDRYLQQLFGPPTQYEGSGYDYSTIMQSVQANVEHAETYAFAGHTDMEISGTDKKGKEIDPAIFRSFNNAEKETWAMELETDEKDLERTIMIFDNSYNATIMLMESTKGEKSRMAYSMDWSAMMDASMSTDSMQQVVQDLTIEKTGNTREILGFTCDEYLTESEDFVASYWVSRDPIAGYASYWSKNNFMFTQQMKNKYPDYFNKIPDGDVLEISYSQKSSKETTQMRIVDIDTSTSHNFVMADYQNVMDQIADDQANRD